MFRIPDDPFLKDAEGSARFARDLLARYNRPRYRHIDWSSTIGWHAHWAAHWAMKSKAWADLATEGR